MSNIKVIEKAPVFVNGFEKEPLNGRIWGFQVGEGIISFHPEVVDLPLRNILIPVMASLGMTNPVISYKLKRSEDTIKSFLNRDFKLLGIPARRRGIARHFFEAGIYEVAEPGENLGLTPAELRVIDNLSWGKTDREAANAITESTGKAHSEKTIKGHLTRIGERTGWHGMEATLAAIVYGEIGNYALRSKAEGAATVVPDLPIPEARRPISFMEYEGGNI